MLSVDSYRLNYLFHIELHIIVTLQYCELRMTLTANVQVNLNFVAALFDVHNTHMMQLVQEHYIN